MTEPVAEAPASSSPTDPEEPSGVPVTTRLAESLRDMPRGGVAVLAAGVLTGALSGAWPQIGVAVASVLLFAVVSALRPDWVTTAVVVLLYSNAAGVAVSVHGLPHFAGVVVLLMLAVPLAYRLLVRRESVVFPPATPWIIAYFVVMVASALVGRNTTIAVDALDDFLVSGFCLYLGVVNAVRGTRLLRQITWALLITGAVLGLLSLHQTVTRSYTEQYLGFAQMRESVVERHLAVTEEEPPPRRVSGPIGEQNRYAQIMIILLPLGLLRMRHETTRKLRWTAGALTAATGLGAALTFSRGGAVAFVATVLLMVVFGHVRVSHLVVFGVGVGVLLAAFPTYTERLATLAAVPAILDSDESGFEADGATLGRVGANLAGLRMFASHPVLGVGPGLFNSYYREHAIEAGYRVHDSSRASHNIYPEVLAEIGALGFLCFAGMIATTLWATQRAWRAGRRSQPETASLVVGFQFALVAYLTTGFFLSMSYQRYFWLLLALASAAAQVSDREPDRGPA